MVAVAIIPARSGSVRIAKKNIRDFRGKPIIAYSIQTAQDSGLFSLVIVSTDDDEIAGIALRLGAAVLWRDKDDGSKGTQEVAGDILRSMPGITDACVIYATAPLLLVDDLKAGKAALTGGKRFAFSVGTTPLCDAGAFYWGAADAFGSEALLGVNTALVPLPPERVCDINTEEDFKRAEQLYDAMRKA